MAYLSVRLPPSKYIFSVNGSNKTPLFPAKPPQKNVPSHVEENPP